MTEAWKQTDKEYLKIVVDSKVEKLAFLLEKLPVILERFAKEGNLSVYSIATASRDCHRNTMYQSSTEALRDSALECRYSRNFFRRSICDNSAIFN